MKRPFNRAVSLLILSLLVLVLLFLIKALQARRSRITWLGEKRGEILPLPGGGGLRPAPAAGYAARGKGKTGGPGGGDSRGASDFNSREDGSFFAAGRPGDEIDPEALARIMDAAPPLVAYKAYLLLAGRQGERPLSLEEFERNRGAVARRLGGKGAGN